MEKNLLEVKKLRGSNSCGGGKNLITRFFGV
jgi:hypothetical protein